jgi:hypothetical protein
MISDSGVTKGRISWEGGSVNVEDGIEGAIKVFT